MDQLVSLKDSGAFVIVGLIILIVGWAIGLTLAYLEHAKKAAKQSVSKSS